jgi:hypothetical protein
VTGRSGASAQPRVVCPTLHVEQMHDDRAWSVFRRSLERLAQRGGRATAFISTRRARAANADLGDRLRWLVDQGHEVAMHTHYRPSGSARDDEPRPLTDNEIVASLEDDYGYLVERGHQPRGFSAGGWSSYPVATEWLETRGFEYDCTFRSFALTYDNPSASPGDNHRGPSVVNGMLQIPTTASLRAMTRNVMRRRYPSVPYDDGTYSLYYLHDWDLLDWRKEVAWRVVARRLDGASVVPVQEIARAMRGLAEPAGD